MAENVMSAKTDYIQYNIRQIIDRLDNIELTEDETEQVENYLDDLDDAARNLRDYLDELGKDD